MSAAHEVRYDVVGGIATVTIDRPEVLNAFRMTTIDQLIDAFDRADTDPGVGAVVLTGTGERAFSTGGDVEMENDFDTNAGRAVGRRLIRLAEAMRGTGKPLVAKIRGWCVGGGNELNLLCDLAVASETARFAHTDATLGNAPIWYATQLLPLYVGERRAREIIMLGRTYSADEAAEMGWINAVVPDDELDATVAEWCDKLVRSSAQALRLTKVSMNHPGDLLLTTVRQGFDTLAYIHETAEFHEGTAAFLEKRAPDFRGLLGSR